MNLLYADVMDLVDVPDLNSGVGNYVPVRPRPSAFFTLEHDDVSWAFSPTLKLEALYYESTENKQLFTRGSFLCAKK